MCGIVGVLGFDGQKAIDLNKSLLRSMANELVHRGPDDEGMHLQGPLGFGFRRLSIVDLSGGNQPFYNDDKSIVMICNGEIFNYKELRHFLREKGYKFKTECDVEVIVYLYEEYGTEFLNMLNGQFAFALYDYNAKKLLLARDHVGIAPLFYSCLPNGIVFGSEIKALLKHPDVKRAVNLQALDQIISFPGMVSPNTMFESILSLNSGHYLMCSEKDIQIKKYWDLDYVLEETEMTDNRSEECLIQELDSVLKKSISYRLNADVPVGYYLSGGIDSSLVASLAQESNPGYRPNSFSIIFDDAGLDERSYQRQMVRLLKTKHSEILFKEVDFENRIRQAVFHAESPLKESYNTCSLALSKLVNDKGIKVVLSGEGADELFAGYVGYRFDDAQRGNADVLSNYELMMEREARKKLWGDENFFYEKNYFSFNQTRSAIYSASVNGKMPEIEKLHEGIVDHGLIDKRSSLHKRSYVDFKLRISDHLVADHGDRVGYANSVEVRYPFLDIDLINFLAKVPSRFKLKDGVEKYILKKYASQYVPKEIISREKFSFVAQNSKQLLQNEWVLDLLSYETIKKQGYFNPDTVERLKQMYQNDVMRPNTTFETDLLMIVITFGMFLDLFQIPNH